MRAVRLFAIPILTLLLAPATARAQKTVSHGDVVVVTASIEAIDHAARLVTLKNDADGTVDTIYAGPEVKRFDALKVGDTVTFRYHESVVLQLRKAGDSSPQPAASGAVSRTPGTKPGGTLAQQMTATVSVVAVDPTVSSITVKTDDGRTFSTRVEDKKSLNGVKAGDRIDITYTQALAISVTAPKQ